MRCPTCQTAVPPHAKFCAECGSKLQAACPRCGVQVAPNAKFCSECGAPLGVAPPRPSATLEEKFSSFQESLPASLREHLFAESEGENRVVTILFADLTASVRSTHDLHPEDAAALVNDVLKAMVDAILKYEGRINRLLGDAVLAFFGTPRAHESDPERAILAALAIREATQA